MATKKKPTTEAAIKPKHVLSIPQRKDDDIDEACSKALTRPEVSAARTIQAWESTHDVDALAKILTQQVESVNNGNMARPEAMLLSQAHTLDELFNNLARKAHDQEHLKVYETFLRLALKAQSQCRTTLETLAAIKNPPIIFAKQANFAENQQINNGAHAPASPAEKIKNQPNELLVEQHGSTTLDTGTTSTTIGKNKTMATLE